MLEFVSKAAVLICLQRNFLRITEVKENPKESMLAVASEYEISKYSGLRNLKRNIIHPEKGS